MANYYIGLSTSGHDPAFAVVNENGEVIFAEATERFFGDKRGWGLSPDHLSHTASVLNKIIAHDPDAKFRVSTSWQKSKLTEHIQINSPFLNNDYLKWMVQTHDSLQKTAGMHLKAILKDRLIDEIDRFEHHKCHAVASYYSCKDSNAICLVVDGEGEVGSVSTYLFRNGQIKRLWRSWGPGSLGTLYSFGTELCGFDWIAGEEWKVMGLAAYGDPDYTLVSHFRSLLFCENGRLRFTEGELFHGSITFLRNYSANINGDFQKKANLAASLQKVFSKIMDEIISSLPNELANTLILSGGCALNSSYNGTISENHNFKNIHISYAPADDGNAIGAALLSYSLHQDKPLPHGYISPYLGREADDNYIINLSKYSSLNITNYSNESPAIVAMLLNQGKIVGTFRNRAEFGPRALGNRSILANPTIPGMKDKLNNIVKGRESYRPFAPVIRSIDVANWMQSSRESLYMSFTSKWKTENISAVQAVVHKDGTGRVQTLHEQSNPWLYKLITELDKLNGVPVLLNTSFNVMGKPIVHTESDALQVLLTTGLDAVLINDHLITK